MKYIESKIATSSLPQIEAYLKFLKKVIDEKSGNNVPVVEDQGKNFSEKLKKIDYYYFISSADYHYFIARILFLSRMGVYSFFCGQQAIENYLKALIKYKGVNVPVEHNLEKLLQRCKDIDEDNKFINSDEIEVIIKMFNPFNELPRYPVQKKRPKDGVYVHVWPDDIYILDYFVLKMREIISVPSTTWDVLTDSGHKDFIPCEENKHFYELFKYGNINFQ